AVCWRGQQLTYRELDDQSTRLADFLCGRGVGPEVLVGVCMERCANLVVAILGILKAGGAYLPLDPGYPPQWLNYIALEARMRLLLTDGGAKMSIDEVETVCIDRLDLATFAKGTGRTTAIQPENLAYVIYSASSNADPIGAAFEHRSVSAFLQWGREQFSKDELAG